jgi:large subunit ribosomal protein L5
VSPAKAGAKTQKAAGTKKAAASKKTSARAGGQRSAQPQTARMSGARVGPDIERTVGRAAGSAGQAVPRLKTRYRDEVQGKLKEELGLKNVMEVPRLEKIVVNMGVGRATQQPSLIEGAQRDMEVITGQKSVVTRAKKSIAGFKLRAGMPIGVRVTLRGDRAWEFLDRLISLAIPRIRDFRGLSPRAFDGSGNYTFGVNEQLIFPEIDYDRIDTVRGMDITIVTTARTDEQARAFLRAFGFPFRQETR